MYVHQSFEPGLWTVGHHTPAGKWIPASDHRSENEAKQEVARLNGGVSLDEEAMAVLRDINGLRAELLGDMGYVPEYVLSICNRARAIVAKSEGRKL